MTDPTPLTAAEVAEIAALLEPTADLPIEIDEWARSLGKALNGVARLIASHRAQAARVAELERALKEIVDGEMPADWHPANKLWWIAGIAHRALGRREWMFLNCTFCEGEATVCPDCMCCEICDVDLHTDECPRLQQFTMPERRALAGESEATL